MSHSGVLSLVATFLSISMLVTCIFTLFLPLAGPPGVSQSCPSQPCTPRTFLGLFSDFFLPVPLTPCCRSHSQFSRGTLGLVSTHFPLPHVSLQHCSVLFQLRGCMVFSSSSNSMYFWISPETPSLPMDWLIGVCYPLLFSFSPLCA